MKIVWCSWKDKKHPLAGGAEQVSDNMMTRLVKDGHELILLTAAAPGLPAEETADGYKVIRQGSRYTVHLLTMRYYRKHLKGWADIVIDEINTAPFFARFYAKTKTIVFVHQLARQIWFYEMPFPLSLIGYLIEPLYLRLLSGSQAITVSNSTKQDLMRHGFKADTITVIRQGMLMQPVAAIDNIKKVKEPTLISFGAVRAMKRTADVVKAYFLVRAQVPNFKLVIAGDTSGPYAQKVRKLIASNPYKDDVTMLHRPKQWLRLIQTATVFASASVKEGWGLTITEAMSQGTPVVVYDIDGLRDSVIQGQTGIITKTNPVALSQGILQLLSDPKEYARLRRNGWQDSKQHTFDNAYADFSAAIAKLMARG